MEIVKLLRQGGADTKVRDNDGKTARCMLRRRSAKTVIATPSSPSSKPRWQIGNSGERDIMRRKWSNLLLLTLICWSAGDILGFTLQAQEKTSKGPYQPGYVARVVTVVTYRLDDATFSALTPEQRAQLAKKGIRVLEKEHALESPERALSNQWLEFGKKRNITNEKGYIHLQSVPAVTKQIKVFMRLHDRVPLGVLETISFVPEPHTPPPSVLRLTYKPPTSMNPESEMGAGPPVSMGQPPHAHETSSSAYAPGKLSLLEADEPQPAQPASELTFGNGGGGSGGSSRPLKCRANRRPCAPRSNSSGCCLDYDGWLGDNFPYNRDPKKAGPACARQGYINFIGSTCFDWTFLKLACINEQAVTLEGPSCWRNHKYRNCQNLDDTDLHLTPNTGDITYKRNLAFKVRNNTPGNYTYLVFVQNPRGAGELENRSKSTKLRKVAALGSYGYELEHFNDKQTKHYEDASLAFKTSRPPKNVCKEKYVLKAFTYLSSAIDTIEITVRNPDSEIHPSKCDTPEVSTKTSDRR